MRTTSAFSAAGATAESGAAGQHGGARLAGPSGVTAARTAAPGWRNLDLRTLARESAQTAVKFALLMGLAFLPEALIVRFLPQQLIASLLGGKRVAAVPLATLVGIPLYTTNLSALAFLIGGAVTTIPAMSAVYGVVKPRVFALYLGFAVVGSLLAGYAFRPVNMLAH